MSRRPESERVIPLPLATHHTANRSSVTCKYRCGDACAHEAPNTSDNSYFGDIVESALSRRTALKATGAMALTIGGAAALSGTAAAAPAPGGHTALELTHGWTGTLGLLADVMGGQEAT